ncbi:hypothetical protein NEUTE2DRAFT_131653 [Neurospora tetrasperma FGSC 2509]|nr:hypothetical protein NEUTE2DRAFT_131653 [Neurospora tetrasperma FGSC 2509]
MYLINLNVLITLVLLNTPNSLLLPAISLDYTISISPIGNSVKDFFKVDKEYSIEGTRNAKNAKARNMARAAPQEMYPMACGASGVKTAIDS